MADGDALGAPTDPRRWRDAVEHFRQRTPVTREEWDRLEAAARRRAFVVSGLASVALVTEVHEAIDQALAVGTTLADFRREIGPKLAAAWGAPNAPRMETIFRTNVQTAYNAGRYDQMSSPAMRRMRPFWRYVSILDGRTTATCAPLNNTVRPADDAFWLDHWPPLHFNCRSTVVSLSRAQAAEVGGVTPVPEHADPGDGFGGPPDLAGSGLAPSERVPAAVRNAYEARS